MSLAYLLFASGPCCLVKDWKLVKHNAERNKSGIGDSEEQLKLDSTIAPGALWKRLALQQGHFWRQVVLLVVNKIGPAIRNGQARSVSDLSHFKRFEIAEADFKMRETGQR